MKLFAATFLFRHSATTIDGKYILNRVAAFSVIINLLISIFLPFVRHECRILGL